MEKRKQILEKKGNIWATEKNVNIIRFPTLHPCMSKDVQRLCLGQVRPKGSTSCT